MHTTPITIREDGSETHESWIVLNASRVTSYPGQYLFDSEIAHQHYVTVRVSRCSRRRDLNHDWVHGEDLLMEVAMSMAQWGAFVSSFGDGSGQPATLWWHDGPVAQAPHDPRLGESVREVRESGDRALEGIVDEYTKLVQAFEAGAGKREMRERIHSLGCRVENAPKNMEFAAKTLVEHTENVVTKARADIEAMLAHEPGRALDVGEAPALTAGDS